MITDGHGLPHRSQSHPDDALGAYALGVLDADEHAAVETHLAGCDTCRAELDRQEAVVGAIGFSTPPVPPGPGLRRSLLAEIAATVETPAPSPHRISPQAPWLAAAALALVSIVVLGVLLSQSLGQRDDARHAEQEIAEYLANGGTLTPLLPDTNAPADVAAGSGSLAVAPNQDRAMLVVHGLEPSGEGRRYMAWAERDGDRVRLGELHVDDQGVGWLLLLAPQPMSSYDTVGVTRFSPDAPKGEPFLVASVG